MEALKILPSSSPLTLGGIYPDITNVTHTKQGVMCSVLFLGILFLKFWIVSYAVHIVLFYVHSYLRVCVCVQKSISFSLVLQEPHTALPHLYKESCGEKKKLTEVLKRDGSERQRDGEGMCTGENQESDGGSEGSESKPVG